MKYLDSTRTRLRALAAGTFQRFLSRREIRSTLVAGALAFFAPFASAVSMTDLGPATDVICLIQAYISGPWLYGIGIVLIIVGAVAIANSESTIGKIISSVFVGLGLAACAVNIVKNHLGITFACA
ncbi:TrbC/VirB2 family protein [Paraburkholderia sediminicola]|uniref:TrbC/VirB2 family protein n=1 Tax=Paraburkholderia sediminicola TaxID=458836 RepID=UPI0038B6B7B5